MADFSGVTFAKQNVTPADDGLIRRALLSDGILTGCNFSYSGYTLSMRAGALIVCGRQIRHPSAQNWAVVGAKSGYARLVLDIDLTKSSTKELFEQVSTTLEYATDEAGFTELIQEDLNVSGSHYQIALCVVSLGEAGITGIVSQLDNAAGTGGNFSVVGGLTQPTSPRENMIWVKADVKKSPKFVVSATAPESPSDGMIWFSAPGRGILTVAYVYANEAWATADTYIYLSGDWQQIAFGWAGELFADGNQYEELTGGWSFGDTTQGQITETAMELGSTTSKNIQNSTVTTGKAVDLTGYSKISCTVPGSSLYYASKLIVELLNDSKRVVATANVNISTGDRTAELELDFSSVSVSAGFVRLRLTHSGTGAHVNYVRISKIWLS